MKELLQKYYRYLIIAGVDLIMLSYIALTILVLLGKVGSEDDWKVANYYYFDITSEVLDDHSSLEVDGNKVYFEYQHEETLMHYQERIRFVSDNRGAIGTYLNPTYLYKAVNEVEIKFTLDNASIYKLQFSDVKVSESGDDTDPVSLSSSGYSLNNKNNVYILKYTHTGDIYIYSVSIIYLVKK